MSGEAVRTHIVVSESLIQEVDRIAGKRKRSLFVEQAIREKLARSALDHALVATAGVLSTNDYPEWNTPEQVSAWVRRGRLEDDARLAGELDPGER
jgi:hypothetical protein